MARENKTKYAVLGLLTYAPLSGYDIRRIYAQSMGNFWSESYGHIYPILKRLEEEGLATHEVVRQGGKPDRNVYTITDAGRTEVRAWLAQPSDTHKERVEVLLKVFLSWETGPGEAIAQVRAFRAEHEAHLARYAHYAEGIAAEAAPPAPYWLLTVRCGQRLSEAMVEWCDEALAELESLPAAPRAGGERWNPGPEGAAAEDAICDEEVSIREARS
jgi:DNA-binding PadR family transcriptional regulator